MSGLIACPVCSSGCGYSSVPHPDHPAAMQILAVTGATCSY
ncbi:MAG: hypothetical protein R2860_16140 [Desulfobacterales bacterium]